LIKFWLSLFKLPSLVELAGVERKIKQAASVRPKVELTPHNIKKYETFHSSQFRKGIYRKSKRTIKTNGDGA
jgi:hypothetical protein